MGRNLVELRREQPAGREDRNQTDAQSDQHGIHALSDHELQNVFNLSTKRHAHADFSSTLLNGVSDGAVNSDNCKQQRDAGKRAEQSHGQPLLAERLGNDGVERAGLKNRHVFVDLVERCAHDGCGRLRLGRGADHEIEKRNTALWPRSVKFDVVGF